MLKFSIYFYLATFLTALSWGQTPEQRPIHGLCTDKAVPIVNFHTVTLADVPPAEYYDCEKYKDSKVLVYRGSRPTQEGVDALVKLGVRTDLDLEEVVHADVERHYIKGRMNFYSVPMSGSEGSSDRAVKKITAIITNPANYPLYIHCARGIDRTGFVVAKLRRTETWTSARAISEWNEFRDNISEEYAWKLYNWGIKLLSD